MFEWLCLISQTARDNFAGQPWGVCNPPAPPPLLDPPLSPGYVLSTLRTLECSLSVPQLKQTMAFNYYNDSFWFYVVPIHGMAGPCTIRRGVRQGCLLSPLLFNIYAEGMMKEAMEEVEEGVRIGGHRIQAVRFADDQAMTASTADGLQNIMTKLNEVVERYKMRINKNKTKVMKIGKGEQEQLQIEIGGNILEQVHQFKYLGSMITEDGRSEKEVRRRIALIG